MSVTATGITDAVPVVTRGKSLREGFSMFRNPKSMTGLIILGVFTFLAIFGPWIAPYDPDAIDLLHRNEPPTLGHLLGTTHMGQDILSQIIIGTRGVMVVGFLAGIFATFIAVVVGVTAGYVSGGKSEALSALTNVFLVIPGLPLIIIVASQFDDPDVVLIAGVLAITGWAWGARVLRAQTMSLRNRDFVQAARVNGEPLYRIIAVEMLPNLLAVIASSFVGTVVAAILAQTTLAFVGVTPISNWNWGTILFWAQSNNAFPDKWWWYLPAGLCIALVGMALALVNFGIDEYVNPRLRSAGQRARALRKKGGYSMSDGATIVAANLEPALLAPPHPGTAVGERARRHPRSGERNPVMRLDLPPDFVFGAATAAFQIEGAAHTDGRTDSVWDTFCRVPGAVINGDDGTVACDHYHRYPADIRIMAELGLDAYRFSTSWSRVRPGHGPVNPDGIAFYDALVDAQLAAGLEPWLTLYHWDLPQELEDLGGWAHRDTADRFVEYAMTMHAALGDRVRRWTTLNEPWCAAFLGYTAGAHAPGRQSPSDGIAAGHHLLLAHGLATQALRAADPSLSLGITLNLSVIDAVDPSDASDLDAARRIDGQINRFFLDPLFRGSYPDDVLDDLAAVWPAGLVRDGDLASISAPLDFLGVNYYHGEAVSLRPAAPRETMEAPTDRATSTPFPAASDVFFHSRELPRTAMDWEVQPEGLTRLLRRLHDEYSASAGTALYVTENGAAYDDIVAPDGAVHDAERVAFLEAHLAAVADAAAAGVDVRGYFYWSLLDNFEWAWGYAKRFGIVRVDYATQERTIKDSARRYAELIADARRPTRTPIAAQR